MGSIAATRKCTTEDDTAPFSVNFDRVHGTAADTVAGFLHDVAGWRKDRVPLRPAGRKVSMRPDWVCEVLSTNKRKDLVAKPNALQQAGVPHYWILDPDTLDLTVLRHSKEGYVLMATVFPRDVARLEPFDAVELDVTRVFGDIVKDYET